MDNFYYFQLSVRTDNSIFPAPEESADAFNLLYLYFAPSENEIRWSS